MNSDHADALTTYAQYYANETADKATMVSVDRLGFKLRLQRANRAWSVRVAFPHEVTTPADTRDVLIAMLRRARDGG